MTRELGDMSRPRGGSHSVEHKFYVPTVRAGHPHSRGSWVLCRALVLIVACEYHNVVGVLSHPRKSGLKLKLDAPQVLVVVTRRKRSLLTSFFPSLLLLNVIVKWSGFSL